MLYWHADTLYWHADTLYWHADTLYWHADTLYWHADYSQRPPLTSTRTWRTTRSTHNKRAR
jgi:hypothetical protein